ncbi:GFA family protein [Wenxinia saemankumensis]|uniref:Uncharacterized conserved protein n=1 Tax=Wenxinia saemankumensis TaxID=1447782 RepID=A0A1M6HH42_9RHOB|nr:GFA family protein [Wenxinia saemankumensis]SHJ21495.1 Uncharacterized conserved protein [Wenxinia saemankumensis]
MDEEGGRLSLPDGPLSGGCQCGAVRFRADRLGEAAHLCHCRQCQKAAGNLFAALIGVDPAALTWTRGKPATFHSSVEVARGFCAACGTPLFWRSADGIGLMLGAFDRAGEIPVGWQSDGYGRHPALGPLAHLRDTFTEDRGPNPSDRQHPDRDT